MSRVRRVVPLAIGLIASSGMAMAEGLPQLDFANKLTTYQVVWGVVIFALLYILASRTALPKVEAVLEERARRIAGDLESAKVAKTRADAGIAAAAEATAKARAEAQTAINAALETAKQAAMARASAENERLDRQLKDAEAQIKTARTAALAALPVVASEAATALIIRLTGSAPDAAHVSGAISAAIASRG